MNEVDSADKDAEDHGRTSAIKVREARATLEEMTKRIPVLDRNRPKAAHISWTQRVLGWFMSRFGPSDLR